ncbi:MAG: amidohydrolase [Phycisphaeraceae bacterium]|nr:amidohydrolase [Phycisphaeraceae bacterium]
MREHSNRLRLAALVGSVMVLGANAAPPDAIYFNGNIYTMGERGRAEAFAIEGGTFGAVGSNAEILALAGPQARRVDLEGRTVLPGLIDAHGHMSGLGAFRLGVLDLSGARDEEEMVAQVVAGVGPAEPVHGGKRPSPAQGATDDGGPDTTDGAAWILGGRWDHESWPSRSLPTHELLSLAIPDRPVWLSRVDGHAGLANAEAMRLAGVTRNTQAPPGGEIVRDRQGNPTGVFIDNAISLITDAIRGAFAGPEDLILAAQQECLSVGLTGVHDAGIGREEMEAYSTLAGDGRLKIRVNAMMSADYAATMTHLPPNMGDRLQVRSIKLYMDGAMGSRGAWLIEPYADRENESEGGPWTGLSVTEPRLVYEVARRALEVGLQVRTHAIGDRGNREVLDAYERALRETGKAGSDHRFAIEHAQMLHPDDIPRFAALGVIASMQPRHCVTDMRWVEDRIGRERAKGTYAWASLLKGGAVVAAGSDFPVEPANPFLGFYAAVMREDEHGEPAGGWNAQERMTREETLRAFTLSAAYASFEEQVKGSIEPGKYADFIVIDRDVMTCDAPEILGTRVLRTVIGGQTVWSAR